MSKLISIRLFFQYRIFDLRVGEGDLTLYVLPVPTVSTSDNSLLLAEKIISCFLQI